MDQNLATKQDLALLIQELKAEMNKQRHDFFEKFQELSLKIGKLESKIENIESRLAVKLGSMLAVSIAILATLSKLM